MAYGVLGPRGTHSLEAAYHYWGNEVNLQIAHSISDLFKLVDEGRVDGALVPMENSLSGSVSETLNCLESYEAYIKGEITIPIQQHLLANGLYELNDIELLISQPVALAQCEEYIHTHLSRVRVEIASSTARAAEIVQNESRKAACIGSNKLSEFYYLHTIKNNISNKNNLTRFVHISSDRNTEQGNKSSMIFTLPDSPGTLYNTLGVFASQNINLNKIESRPSKSCHGYFTFYIEITCSEAQLNVKKLLLKLEKYCSNIRFLGSYKNRNQ